MSKKKVKRQKVKTFIKMVLVQLHAILIDRMLH